MSGLIRSVKSACRLIHCSYFVKKNFSGATTRKRLALLLLTIFSVPFTVASAPIQLEIKCVSNDELTVLFQRELVQKISHSRDFVMAKSSSSQLTLIIAENVNIKRLGNQNQVTTRVEFTTGEKIIGISMVRCWQERLSDCAEQVLHDARLNIPH